VRRDVAHPGTRAHASRGRARPKARPARAALAPSHPPPLDAPSPRRSAAVRVHAPRTGGPSAASPPYARCPSRRSTAGISAVIHRHEPLIKAACSPSARHHVLPPPLPPPHGARALRSCSLLTNYSGSTLRRPQTSPARLLPNILLPSCVSPCCRGHRRRPPPKPVAGHSSATTQASHSP
jgi:hypothetical protein